MATPPADIQSGEQTKQNAVPLHDSQQRQSTSVSIQTQTEVLEETTPSQQSHANIVHAQVVDGGDAAASSQSVSMSQSAQEFMIHPPAPPQEGGSAQQRGETQELLQVQTSGRILPSEGIPFGSVLKPIQATLIPLAIEAHSSNEAPMLVQPTIMAAAVGTAQVIPARPRAPPRKPLNISQKLAIINLHKGKERVGTAELAARFGVPERTIKQVCTPQNEEKLLKNLKRPEKLSQEDRAALRRRMISKACTGKARLTVAQKLQIIKLHETSAGKTGVPAAQLAEQFNVAERTIRKICCEKQRERLERFSQSEASIDAMRLCREDLYPDLTKQLLKWVEAQARSAAAAERPLTQSVILQKAIQIGSELGVANFKGSKGWMHRWMKRYNIRAIIDGSAMLPSAARAMKEAQDADGGAGGEVESVGGMGMLGLHGQGGGGAGSMSEVVMATLLGGSAGGRVEPVMATPVERAGVPVGLAVVTADSVVLGPSRAGRSVQGRGEGEGGDAGMTDAAEGGGRRVAVVIRRTEKGGEGGSGAEGGADAEMVEVDAGAGGGDMGGIEIVEARAEMEPWAVRG